MSDLLLTLLLGTMQGGLYTLVGLGLTITFGVTHILNFAHGEFVTLGAFAFIIVAGSAGVLAALPVALLIAALAAGLLYLVGFIRTIGDHLQGLAFSMGVLLLTENLFLEFFSANPRTGPRVEGMMALPGGEQIAWSRVIVIIATAAIVIGSAFAMKRSWVGLALRATGDDRFAASTLGLSARRIGLYAFLVAAVFAGVAGICIASVSPVTPTIGVSFLLTGFVVVIIGGLGSPEGVLMASMILGILEALVSRYIDPSMTMVYTFAAMIVVLLVMPQGLFNRKVVRAG